MDEEYDVLSLFFPLLLELITIATGHCPWNWPDRMYPLRSVIRRGVESPPHGQE